MRAYVALGTNEGNRLLNLAEAKRRLALAGELIEGPLLETDALLPREDPTPQPKYLNTVVALRVELDPFELHAELKRIERQMGRRATTRWAPRIIDLDLILYGDQVIDTPQLTVPHPRMHERAFVLRPLTFLAPHERHPVLGESVSALLARLRRAVAK